MTKPQTVLTVDSLGKCYAIGGLDELKKSFREMLTDLFFAPIRRYKKLSGKVDESELFWALKDINFSLKQGEVVGVIGKNGAGKSTLLKVLSRITTPTEGAVTIKGNVASLLEVGTGFHPELTGRENIYLNGAILGMKRKEINEKFNDIVEFADIEKFVDTPVKRYSSGMYVRLAFSVAAHLDPDILIVDEVLAVGDSHFQKRCMGKISDVASQGRTVLFVSHNMYSISQLCSRVIWLENGQIIQSGSCGEVISKYLASDLQDGLPCWSPKQQSKNGFSFKEIYLSQSASRLTNNIIKADEDINFHFNYIVKDNFPSGRIAFRLTNSHGVNILASANTDKESSLKKSWQTGEVMEVCTIPAFWLSPGRYSFSVSEPNKDDSDILHENILSFWVDESTSLKTRDNRDCIVMPLLNWTRK